MTNAIPHLIAAGLILSTAAFAAPSTTPLFRSSGNPLQYANTIDTIRNAAGFVPQAPGPELSLGGLPGDWGVYWVPTHSGVNVIRFAGAGTGPNALCAMKAYTVDIPIDSSTMLDYWLFPQQEDAEYVGVDLHCTDGTLLSETNAVDQNGARLDPGFAHGGKLAVRQWSEIKCAVGKWLAGKTVDKILVTYKRAQGGGQYRGYVDDIVITDGALASPTAIATSTALAAPDWARKGVIYSVSERQFSASGDLAGVDAGLPRLRSLGITVLWLLPFNTIGSLRSIGSPYCVRDYYGIDPRYGTSADLKKLVDDSHALGIKVILDEVLDHTSWDNVLISKHPEWYRHDDNDVNNQATISRTPMWGDVAQLDYSHPGLRDYMTQMLRYWVKTYDVDGFRFDAAELVPTEFLNQASASLRAVKPDLLLLGESHRPETMVSALNLDYSFTLYPAIAEVLKQKQPASFIKDAWEEEHAMFPRGTLHMRYTGNQDTDKAAVDFGPDAAHAFAVLAFTLDGVPMLYNGTEIDDTASGGFLDNGKIDWSGGQEAQRTVYKPLVDLRKSLPALQSGKLDWVTNSEPDKLLTFTRTLGNQQVFVAVNLSSTPISKPLPLPGSPDDWRDVSPWGVRRGVSPSALEDKPYGFYVFVKESGKQTP